jgi:hypothetical protein
MPLTADNIDLARQDGFKDDDILNTIRQNMPEMSDRIDSALSDGFKPTQIVDHFRDNIQNIPTQPPEQPTVQGQATPKPEQFEGFGGSGNVGSVGGEEATQDFDTSPIDDVIEGVDRFGAGVGTGTVGTIGSIIGGVGWLADSDVAKDLSKQVNQWVRERTPPDPGFMDALASGVGSSVAFWIPGFGTSAAAGLLANVAPRMALWAGAGVAATLESMAEAGGTYQNVFDQTQDKEKADRAARNVFLSNIPLIAITNKLGVFGDKGGRIRRAIVSGLVEGGQEVGQELISALAEQRKVTPKELATAAGVGAILGGVGGQVMPTLFKSKSEVDAAIDMATENEQIQEEGNEKGYKKIRDAWLGERWWQRQKASSDSAKLQQEIMATTGEKKVRDVTKDVDRAIQIHIDLKRNPGHYDLYYEHLTPEQRRLVDLSQNLTPEQLSIADKIQSQYRETGNLARGESVINNMLDNYAARVWKATEPRRTAESGRKFGTTTKHAQARKLDTILEGWANGMELQVEGATNTLAVYKQEIHNTIQDKRFIKELKKLTDLDGNPILSSEQLEGHVRVEHPGFKDWEYSNTLEIKPVIETLRSIREKSETIQEEGGGEAIASSPMQKLEGIASEALQRRGFTEGEAQAAIHKIKTSKSGSAAKTIIKTIESTLTEKVADLRVQKKASKNFVVTPEGVLLERKELYAPKKIANNLNNILGTSKLKDLKTIKALTNYNATIKSWRLMTSLFHHLAYMRSLYLGSAPFGEAIENIKKGEGFMKSLAALTPRQQYLAGRQAILESGPEIELLVRNELTLGEIQDWEENVLKQQDTFVGRMMDKHGATKAIKDKINQFRDNQAEFLFKHFGAGLKAKAALIELRAELRRNPTEDPNTVARRVARLINDDFGGLNLQAMNRDPTFQHLFRLAALAPDWTESNIRSAVKAMKFGKEGKLYRRFWARIITKSLLATVLANVLLNGDELPEVYTKAWEDGKLRWLDVDITEIYKLFGGETDARKYFSIAGHFKDPLRFAVDAIKAAHYKGSPIYSTIHELITGKDWAEREFTEIPELIATGQTIRPPFTFVGKPNKYSQMPSYLLSRGKGSMPIQVEQILNYWMGETEAFDAILTSLGMGVKTTFEPTAEQRSEVKNLRKVVQKMHPERLRKKRSGLPQLPKMPSLPGVP